VAGLDPATAALAMTNQMAVIQHSQHAYAVTLDQSPNCLNRNRGKTRGGGAFFGSPDAGSSDSFWGWRPRWIWMRFPRQSSRLW